MKRIFKYVLEMTDTQDVEMPKGAKLLHADNQNDKIVLWAQVNTTVMPEKRRFRIYGTGHELPDDPGRYVGTVLIESGFLVLHVYEIE